MSVELRPTPTPHERGKDTLLKINSFLLVLVLGGLIALAVAFGTTTDREDSDLERTRAVASRLKAVGLLDEASELYDKYLESAPAGPDKAKFAYSLAELYLQRGDYEEALRWLYEADELGPGELKDEVGQRIVHALEALGRVHAAQAALDSRTKLEPGAGVKKSPSDPVVARIGKTEVRRSEVMQALDDLPQVLKQEFSGKDGLEKFLKKYVADELIYRKAEKLEYDKDPEVRKRLQAILKQVVAARFVEKEIASKLKADEQDLKNFFEAHRKQYDEPDKAEVRFIELASKAEAVKVKGRIEKGMPFAEAAKKFSLDKKTAGNGGAVDGWVYKGQDFLGKGDPRVVSDVVFNTPAGKVSDPTPAGGNFFLFLTEKVEKGKKASFDDVRDRVERDYKAMKAVSMYNEMLKQAMKAEDVELFPENLKKE